MEDSFLLDRLSGECLSGYLPELRRPVGASSVPLASVLLLVVLGVKPGVRPVALGAAEERGPTSLPKAGGGGEDGLLPGDGDALPSLHHALVVLLQARRR